MSGDTIPEMEEGEADDTVWEFSLLMTLAVKSGRKEQADAVEHAGGHPPPPPFTLEPREVLSVSVFLPKDVHQ